MVKIPNLKKLLKEAESWKVSGWKEKIGNKKVWRKKSDRSQHTIPSYKNLLKKIGLIKSDKILIIAGYYGDWTNAIANAGCKTIYSELSKSLVEYAIKKFGANKNILKFICADYMTLPKKELEFDWTITFESIGGDMGLPLAIIRGLLNKKGIKIIHYPRENKPAKSYLRQKIIAKAYNCQFNRKEVFIKGINQKLQTLDRKHIITIFSTNNSARNKAKQDLESLESGRFSEETLDRLSKISKLMNERFLIDK